MAKNNREIVTLGHVRKHITAPPLGVPVLTPPDLAQLRDEQVVKENRSRFAELLESETEAALAKAHADDVKLAAAARGEPFYTGSADPGSIVGLDGATPDSDAAEDGDTKRSDPNAG